LTRAFLVKYHAAAHCAGALHTQAAVQGRQRLEEKPDMNQNRLAVITGAAGGLGVAASRALGQTG
jgi:predicted dinucleotide-utilizing enzyme